MTKQDWGQPVQVTITEMQRKAINRSDKRFPFYEDVIKRLEQTDVKKFAIRYEFADKKTANYYRTYLGVTAKSLLGKPNMIKTRVIDDGDRAMLYVTRGENWNGRTSQ